MIGTILCALLLWPMRRKAFLCSFCGVLSFLLGGLIVNPFLPWFSTTVIAVAAFSSFITANQSGEIPYRKYLKLKVSFTTIGLRNTNGFSCCHHFRTCCCLFIWWSNRKRNRTARSFFMKTGNQLLKAAFLSGLQPNQLIKQFNCF